MDKIWLEEQVAKAVAFFWNTRSKQGTFVHEAGEYIGNRAQVTGGKQLDGFAGLLREILLREGIGEDTIFIHSDLELPGYFRANKKWDLLVIEKGRLLAAVELKSQVGPSFSNNFNNRTEEAMGSALDLWTAYREGAFGIQPQPWLGYLMVLEECEKSTLPVKNREPHFPVLDEFSNASYKDRYEIFCKKLMLERQYTQTCFITTTNGQRSAQTKQMMQGTKQMMQEAKQAAQSEQPERKTQYSYPNEALSFPRFADSLLAYIRANRSIE